MKHTGTQPLHTARLTLLPQTAADAIPMFENWASDPEVTRYLRWEPHQSWTDTAALLAAWEPLYQNPDYYQWGIHLNESGVLIGSISLQRGEESDPAAWRAPGLDFSQGVWDPGYCIGRAFWNRGYTTEALLAVLIIMGLWVRMSALVMSLGILLMFAWGGFGAGEPEFAWLGIYVFLIVSGGRLYAFDAALTPSDRKK